MRITKAFEDMERPVKFKEDDAMAIDAVCMHYAHYNWNYYLGMVVSLICKCFKGILQLRRQRRHIHDRVQRQAAVGDEQLYPLAEDPRRRCSHAPQASGHNVLHLCVFNSF